MHKNLICEASPFFQNAFARHNWKETQEGFVSLPDDSVDVVHSYVRWIYLQKVITPSPQWDKKRDDPVQDFLAACYAFGDKVQDIDFKDAVIDASLQRTRNMKNLSGSMIKTIYAHTHENSPARKLYVDILYWWGSDEVFQRREWMKQLRSEDFLLDCIAALAKSRYNGYNERTYGKRAPYENNSCIYHEHTKTGGLCYKEKRSGNL